MTTLKTVEKLIPAYLQRSKKFYVVLVGIHGEVLYTNACFHQKFGQYKQSFSGNAALPCFNPDEVALYKTTFANCLRHPEASYSLLLWQPSEGDNSLSVEWELCAFNANQGQPVGVICIGKELSHAGAKATSQKDEERKLLDIVNNLSEIFCTSDLRLQTTFISQTVRDVLGYSASRAREMQLLERFTPASVRHLQEILKEELQIDAHGRSDARRKRKIEAKMYHADGSERDVLITASFVRDERMKPIGVQAFIRDITEEKAAERQRNMFSKRLEEITNTNGIVIWEVDAKGRYTYINEAIMDSFGIKPEDIIQKRHFYELVSEPEREAFRESMLSMMNARVSWSNVAMKMIDPSGKPAWYLTSCNPTYGEDGNYTGYRGCSIDITKQKQVEEELLHSENKLKALLAEQEATLQTQSMLVSIASRYIHIPLAEVEASTQESLQEIGQITKADRVVIYRYNWDNGTATATQEWCREPLASKESPIRNVYMKDFQRWKELHMAGQTIIQKSIEELDKRSTEFQILRAHNVRSFISVPLIHQFHCTGCIAIETTKPEVHFNEQAIALLHVFAQLLVNIQQRTRADEELLRMRVMLEQAGHMAQVGAFELDLKNDMTYWSKSCFDIHELEVGSPPSPKESLAFYRDDEARSIMQEIFAKATTDPEYNVDYKLPIITAKGKERWIHVLSKSEFEGDTCVKIYGTVRDITEDIKHKDRQEKLLSISQDQTHRLRNFAHIVAHNLRSHSGNIEALLEIISKSHPEIAGNSLIQLLIQVSNNLKETLSHLSDIALLRTTKEDALEAIRLQSILQKAIEVTTARVGEVTIQMDFDENLEVMGIPAYLDSIFLNLLSNAVKYRREEVPCIISVTASAPMNGKVSIAVSDNGKGIDLQKHGEKLFGLYKTFHNHPDARGLGLFITKNQIESMGGSIHVKSAVGKGATFEVVLKSAK